MISLEALMGHDHDDTPTLTHEQQITRLTELFAQVHAVEPERFEPGQIVWHKNAEMAITKVATEPHLFLGYLPEPIDCSKLMREPQDVSSSASALVVDCRCISIMRGHGATHLMDSRELTTTEPRKRT